MERLKQEYDKNRDGLKDEARDSIIERYGGEEHLDSLPTSLLLAQTEEYVEYSRCGKVRIVFSSIYKLRFCDIYMYSVIKNAYQSKLRRKNLKTKTSNIPFTIKSIVRKEH